MRPLDDTDREILRLLDEDGRRPYSDIGTAVGLSGPAVSDRIERLRERGIIQGFSVDLDRSVLQAGLPCLLTLEVDPGSGAEVADALLAQEDVERVLRTAGERVLATATVPEGDATGLLREAGVLAAIDGLDVELVASRALDPGLGEVEFSPDCAECDNSVDAEGTSAALGGETYYFCCESCEAAFTERYETLEEGA